MSTYYFIGIKGAGMSALALLLHELGEKVVGSDYEKYFFTQRELDLAGVEILPFNADNIKKGYKIIAGNAFRDDHEEIKRAKALGLKVQRYHEFLGEFMDQYTSIGVAGAHGKTSTTGLLAHVLSDVTNASYLIGDGTGHGDANSKYFVFESDEYERHFLPYHPEYTIITNIDFDHPDYFENIEDVFDAFQTYAKQIKKGIFAFGDDVWLRKLEADCPIYYYGTSEQDDFRAVNISRSTTGSSFDAFYRDQLIGHFTVPTFGFHNVMNALAVVAVSYISGVDMSAIARSLLSFAGVKRRFSEKIVSDMIIIDDFAHHPAEISATLDAARQKYPHKEIVAVFQPHTFTRTIALLDEFAESLNSADQVYLGGIYGSAREVDHGDIKIEDLAAKIDQDKGGIVLSEDNVSPLLDLHNSVVVFMGAGDIQKYERAYEELLTSISRNKQ
ncbi:MULTISPECIES: UDP-N-acetylmuramate--L-alanine ligase [unclassified Enterococcus]|uniref:UDP-N-acetylmuramate--L-alanine ligase n=1 Tax=unclassified Enterococcus TaxID=2608891 RepID=UPI0015543C12|nr:MULTISPECIES: UDP-N-acetylmuramate--L-alanine ligase [unclassified Enterococcus]MBS7578352.1 UDP-N-acetylmuramate--L-alanine ligase [Enterococcus sp. MMGLQ5-2]MBS7585589.1 UDP-N-acetylmuramate--L-alanine ligase [Enterococcus sp. MMGLQ5-1]NPD13448.1 UDP-N-acetylmuramate--L-alanine ligase [Enterococcus sp. MMGLQ5-1]NPD38183.1 UDP-N-acetylmuramate--L-alanine ligase [Enterococcus sp. MMGLQ5-2]